jgi:hypothetical protein
MSFKGLRTGVDRGVVTGRYVISGMSWWRTL